MTVTLSKVNDKKNNPTDKEIKNFLNGLGRLDSNFDANILKPYLHHHNKDIRFLAIKNIGKIKDIECLNIAKLIYEEDPSSMVRRECVSTIGRMKSEEIVPILIKILDDNDPKIVLQAIRGLLPFKKRKVVINAFERVKNHPNEIIKEIINIELSPPKKTNRNHLEVHEFLKNVIVNGNVREVLKLIPEDSMHLSFTSPPYYNARDYSIYKSYNEYLEFLSEVFKELYRVTKEGRFFILNTSPVIVPRTGRKYSSKRYAIPFDIHTRLVAMGWEFVDDIIWLKPEGSAKNRIGGFIQHRKPLAYKPNIVTEYLMVYRKNTGKLIDWNIKQYDEEVVESSKVLGEYDHTNVWKINPDHDDIHPAVFPEDLCDKVIKYYSYKKDLVFDPFSGSGTLAKSALKLGRYFFLSEIQEKYFNRIKEKLVELPLDKIKKPKFINLTQFKGEIQ
ncbi:MAG: HEAT repeat domain-containing protein [Methanobrevibacter sp.]|jgi:DNA modification methylase|nr:HEAT repeat domain-containing protein [Candidatus Methanovirga meridionalis]